MVPSDTGIVYPVNLEYLNSMVFAREANGVLRANAVTVVGTDSHTMTVNLRQAQ